MRERAIKWDGLTKTKQKELARQTASKAFNVKYPNNYQVGQARKIIRQIVNDDPAKYLNFYDKYCTPKSKEIVEDAAKLLNPQDSLFDLEMTTYG